MLKQTKCWGFSTKCFRAWREDSPPPGCTSPGHLRTISLTDLHQFCTSVYCSYSYQQQQPLLGARAPTPGIPSHRSTSSPPGRGIPSESRGTQEWHVVHPLWRGWYKWFQKKSPLPLGVFYIFIYILTSSSCVFIYFLNFLCSVCVLVRYNIDTVMDGGASGVPRLSGIYLISKMHTKTTKKI